MLSATSATHPRALITGASSGIGHALAHELQKAGYEVFGTSRKAGRGTPGQVPLMQLDAASPYDLSRFLQENAEQLSSVSVLVNNAGAGHFGDLCGQSDEDVRKAIHLLLETPVALTRAVLPDMRARGRGQIVYMSSLAALFPLPYMAIYSSTKAALSQFAAGMALVEGRTGVKFLDVQAGDFRTGFNRNLGRPQVLSEAEKAAWQRLEQLLENGPPAERAARGIARAVARSRGGQLRIGGFFQARIAPLGARLLPQRLLMALIRFYYGLPGP